MKPIIFLGIDGVIVTQYGLDHSLKIRGETYDNEGRPYFCPDACDHINKLVIHYDAEIVLISSWRSIFKNAAVANDFFKNRGYKWPIIDFTPNCKNNVRATEIYKWITKNGVPKRYVIINSDSDLSGYFENQVVDIKTLSGFADRKLYRKSMNILKRDAVVVETSKEEKELF